MNVNITPEVIAALATLRKAFLHSEEQSALDTLDNAGVFSQIDEATDYDVNPAPEMVANGLDPAEWGDMAFTAADNLRNAINLKF